MVLRPDFVCIEQIEFVTNRGRTSSIYDDRRRPWLKRVALYTKTLTCPQVKVYFLHKQPAPESPTEWRQSQPRWAKETL
jgi:hypothetical protein